MLNDVNTPNRKNPDQRSDGWDVYNVPLQSRFLIGSAQYPSPLILQKAVEMSGAQVITVSLRRQSPEQQSGNQFWNWLRSLGIHILPNTAGCHSVKEAVALAQMSRELFSTNWIKLEVIGDDYNLQPDTVKLVEAAERLIALDFNVFPYCTDDLVVCKTLAEMGCEVVMPWGSPIGTGRGLINPYALKSIRDRLPETKLIVDAGLGRPSDACQAMEMGYDGVLLNSAVAKAVDPVKMADSFRCAIIAGRLACQAGAMPKRQTASPSTPTAGMPFWHQTTG